MHIIVVESSYSPLAFRKTRAGANISKIFILTPILCTSKLFGGSLRASNSAALAVRLGEYLGNAPYVFFSHSDMMGYKKNFLSFLLSKLDNNTVLACFNQRHILPFAIGGAVYDKNYFNSLNVDWLPKLENPYYVPELDQVYKTFENCGWLDAGEQFVFEIIRQGKRIHVCASRGLTGDYYGHPLKHYNLTNEAVRRTGVPIHYTSLSLSRENFAAKYPEFSQDNFMWDKSFDDEGDVVFVHRGRGTSGGDRDHRGDFVSFVCNFNKAVLFDG